MKKLLPAILLIITLVAPAAAQNSSNAVSNRQPILTANNTQEDPLLKALEEAADRIKRLEVENEGLKTQVRIKDEQLAVRAEQVNTYKEQVTFWKDAAETAKQIFANSNQIDRNSQQALGILQLQHQEDLARIRLLEQENEALRRSRANWRTGALAAGAAAIFGFSQK